MHHVTVGLVLRMSTPALPQLVTEFDWSCTPLGDQANWPQSLHTVVKLVLSSAFPMILLWGRDLIQIYNDGYAVIMGERHPAGLGQPTRQCWPEMWHINEPIYERVWQGETFYFENQLYPMTRKGFLEEAYFTLCYSPVHEDGHIGGVLVTVTETTAQVVGQRRTDSLRAHAEALAPVQTVRALQSQVQRQAPQPDVPFSELLLVDRDAIPPELRPVVETRTPLQLNWSASGKPPQPALAFPVDGAEQASGVLILGLNPRVPLDDPYRSFLENYARQASAAFIRIHSQEQHALNRKLEDERAALTAFAQFTERAARHRDLLDLVVEAANLLRSVLHVRSATYFELQGKVWQARHIANPLNSEVARALQEGVPGEQPDLAGPHQRREVTFLEHWNAAEQGTPVYDGYKALARYPLYPKDHVPGLLGMAKTDPTWTEREKAVFRAVGDSLRLALERAEMLRQAEVQRQRLADLNAELSVYITRTAHTLERPAQYLSGLVNQQENAATFDPHILQDELVRLSGVAQDLRQLSTLEEQPLHQDFVPLNELLEEVQAELNEQRQGVEWLIKALPIVRGDRELLRQALRQTLNFSLSDTRGATQVEVTSEEIDGEVQLCLWDNGTGLSPEEASTLFDLAVRSDQHIPLFPGSGLAQVRRILARHGGWAWAESHLRGARIALALPHDQELINVESLILGE